MDIAVYNEGSVQVEAPWPVGIPGGIDLWFQFWMPAPSALNGWAASNGIKGAAL
jgi:hypothetical protein